MTRIDSTTGNAPIQTTGDATPATKADKTHAPQGFDDFGVKISHGGDKINASGWLDGKPGADAPGQKQLSDALTSQGCSQQDAMVFVEMLLYAMHKDDKKMSIEEFQDHLAQRGIVSSEYDAKGDDIMSQAIHQAITEGVSALTSFAKAGGSLKLASMNLNQAELQNFSNVLDGVTGGLDGANKTVGSLVGGGDQQRLNDDDKEIKLTEEHQQSVDANLQQFLQELAQDIQTAKEQSQAKKDADANAMRSWDHNV